MALDLRNFCKSTFIPGCIGCQDDGMTEHYAGIHLCFGRDYVPNPGVPGDRVWKKWVRENLPKE